MRFCFVTAANGNHFMTELLDALRSATAAAGHAAELVADEFPADAAVDAYVVIPHELHGTVDPSLYPTQEQCARTIALCTENPGGEWFQALEHLIPHFGACAAINRATAAAVARLGLPCTHIPVGYSSSWDVWGGRAVERPIDVLYLGSADRRRDSTIASFGRWLGHRESRVLRPPVAPKPQARPDYLCGEAKYRLLCSAKVLVNLHREGTENFEWVRYLEATANGCVVASEPSLDAHPLVAGEHLVVAAAASLPLLVDRLLDEPERLQGMRTQAYQFIREQLPMSAAAAALAELAATLPQPPRGRRPGARTTLPDPPAADPAPPPDEPVYQAELQSILLEARELRRELGELAHRTRTGREAEVEEVLRTPAFAAARPRVSVLITLHDYEREVLDALASVAASDFRDLEVLVLDDASTDMSLDAAAGFLRAQPWLPAVLLRHPVNRGLGRSRDVLAERARGGYLFVLDADNGVYPTALGRLVAALDADPGATFAYPMIAAVDSAGRPQGLLSASPWEPARLPGGNYIDAMAMLRRDELLELGGYSVDPRLTGWEDFHLWCRCAEAGRRGVLVPSVLAWYRQADHSMLRQTERSTSAAWSLMYGRFPELLTPA